MLNNNFVSISEGGGKKKKLLTQFLRPKGEETKETRKDKDYPGGNELCP